MRTALLSTIALIPAVAAPRPPVVLTLLAVAGAGASFAAPLNAVFVRRVTPGLRGRAMGVATSCLLVSQGAGFLLAGAAIEAGATLNVVVGLSGLLGTAVVTAAGMAWRRSFTSTMSRLGNHELVS